MADDDSAKPRGKGRLFAKVISAILLVWLGGDFVYSKYVAYKVSQWEKSVERDDDGVLTGCQAFTAGEENEDSTALLLVHGINASPRHWEKMAPRLADAGFTCRALRLPGFCEPIDRYEDSTRGGWKSAIKSELAQLRQSHDRVGVVAHSLGGAATIGALLDDPDAADFAALLAPALAVSDARSPLLPTRWWHEFGSRALFFTTVMESPFPIDSHDPENLGYPGRCPFTPAPIVDELYKLMDENGERASEFKVPLLTVLTEADLVIDWQAAKRFYEQAASERKELLMLDDSGHAVPIDYGWEETTDAITAFARGDAGE